MRAFEEGKLEILLAEIQYIKHLMDYAQSRVNFGSAVSDPVNYSIWMDRYLKLKKEYDGTMSLNILHWLNE